MLRNPSARGAYMLRNPSARGAYMLRKPVVLVFIRFGCWRGIMGNCYENNLATEDTEKKQKNLCNLRNLWVLFFRGKKVVFKHLPSKSKIKNLVL